MAPLGEAEAFSGEVERIAAIPPGPDPIQQGEKAFHAMVAVGTALEGGPPLRSQRAGLPHWAPASGSDGQALGREGVHHAGWWEPSSSK